MVLTLSLLGETEVSLNGNVIDGLCAEKAQALLFYLAVESERAHRRESLAEMLWPERPPGYGRNNLKQTLSQLKKALGDRESAEPYLISSKRELQFNAGNPHRVDALEFEEHLQKTKTHEHENLADCELCLETLLSARELYRDEFLSDFYLHDSPDFNEWLLAKREYYRRLMVDAVRNLISCHEKQGEYSKAAAYAKDLVELEPWSEWGQRKLMGQLALSGKRSAALRQYQTCKTMLKDEFGALPSPETIALYEKIKNGEIRKISRSIPPASTPEAQESTLMGSSERSIKTWVKVSALISSLILAAVVYATFFRDKPILPLQEKSGPENELDASANESDLPGLTNQEAATPSSGDSPEGLTSAKPLADPDQVCLDSEKLLYWEDFQDGQAQGWPEIQFEAQNWKILPDPEEPENLVAQNPGKHSSGVVYQDSLFQDAVLRIHFLVRGNAQPVFLWHANSDPYQEDRGQVTHSDYSIGFMSHGTLFVRYTFPLPEAVLLDSHLWLINDTWHQIEISTYQGMLSVWLDGVELLTYQDPNPLPIGSIGLVVDESLEEESMAYFDNISVCELSDSFISIYTK